MNAKHARSHSFSWWRWATTGVIRVLYRFWTRIAVRLFPEGSGSARFARKIGIPLPDRLNMSWITSQLSVGGRIRNEDLSHLQTLGLTHVVDTRSEFCDDREALARYGIDLLYLPTPDTYPLSVEQLAEGSRWINEQIAKGGKVLIHCEHGVGRSVLLTCSSLVQAGASTEDALTLVKSKRWQAAPNHRQVKRLEEFSQYCQQPVVQAQVQA